MKSFLTVLKFEIMHYLKAKVFQITTLILLAMIIIGLSIPTIMENFNKEETTDIGSENYIESEEVPHYGLYDPEGYIQDIEILNNSFYLGEFTAYNDLSSLKKDINNNTIIGGYALNSPTDYQYIMLNNEMMDNGLYAFEQAYTYVYRVQVLNERNIEYSDVEDILYPNFNVTVDVLGKDSAANYGYTYILVFGLYMIIIMYGQLIATAVASEKSNRTMEILVTSTKTSYLIFGKVIAGAIVSLLQFGVLIGAGKITYALNDAAWDGKLDMIFKIPGEILLQFAAFGILGYLFFTFIFGALGALVSKTEDVNTSATPVTLIFVIVFMIAITGMQNTEGIVLKIASFVPFSSFLAMFVRVSMGSVTWYEVVISLGILGASTYIVGVLASKIYRMGTLMYGNPVKIKDIPKILKSQ